MDGAYLFTFNGTHGDIAKIYHKSFGDQIHTLEFIMNQQGQLIANDPADDDRFTPPPIQMSAQLGSLAVLCLQNVQLVRHIYVIAFCMKYNSS